MEESLLRRKMMDLWKDTFHDSDRYVNLVFDAYFDPENVFVHFDGETLVAMMLTVPYQFEVRSEGGACRSLRGVYLCGLATLPEYRRQGIMSRLMIEAEHVMIGHGMDLMFLIPADEHLRSYYARMGYYNATVKSLRNIQFSQNVSSESEIFPLRPFMESAPGFVVSLAQRCRDIDMRREESSLIHQVNDMMAVFRENENTFLVAQDLFEPEYPDLTKVSAIVFPDRPVGSSGEKVKLSAVYFLHKDEARDLRLREDLHKTVMNRIAGAYPASEVTLIKTSSSHDGCPLCEPYAIVKILPKERHFEIPENPGFHN